jgi:hypothetical protein
VFRKPAARKLLAAGFAFFFVVAIRDRVNNIRW